MLGSSRIGGVAFLVGIFLYFLGEFLHPRTGEGFPGSTDVHAELIADNITLWYLSHAIIIIVPLSVTLGFLVLYGILNGKGERAFSLPAIFSVGLSSVLSTLGTLMDGFVNPVLAENYLALSGGAKESAGLVFGYSRLLVVSLAAGGLFSLFAGIGLFSVSMVKAKLYGWALGWVGVVLGLIGTIGYVVGIFQPYYLLSPLFLPFLIIFSIWGIVLGIFLYRGR